MFLISFNIAFESLVLTVALLRRVADSFRFSRLPQAGRTVRRK